MAPGGADLRAARAVVLDLDGVVYRGRRPLPGAREFVAALRRRRIPFVFATNNSAHTVGEYAERLEGMGISASPEQIVTSAVCAADYLRNRKDAPAKVFVIGGPGLRATLRQAGFALADAPPADAVVVGLDVELTYARLRDACIAIRRGASFVATNRDANLPVEDELWPGSGAIVAAIETSTGVSPVVLGKPEPYLFEMALRRLGAAAAETVMVGDQVATDIAGAARVGMRTALVLSGVSAAEDPAGYAARPDVVVVDLHELARLLGLA
ncbi:MAG: HAD-IIA family hydrolase [Armatimonadota bacterium]|nr:HAD-IIA family hydrolase [Armatimonadota bacterium]MDR5696295.1 HAD-IIA family hydrolase [Armatimonadota bacterium]